MVRTIRTSYFGVFAVLVTMALLCVLAGSSGATARDTTRVSVDSSGAEANDYSGGSYGYSDADISDDGRYVAFSSYATNLVDGDTNGFGTDIFVHDRTTRTTERVSVNSSGAEANGGSYNPSISADGRYVAFLSDATNLVPDDTNNAYDVFVHDRSTGMTERVSVNSSGAEANGGSSWSTISADGRYVAFDSDASNLVANDSNGAQDVFVYDRTTATTERVSVGTMVEGSATQTNGASSSPSISADGRYVAFDSDASNLVANDSDTSRDVFVYDRTTGATQWVSEFTPCFCTAAQSSYSPSISADGRYVAFTGSTSNGSEIFVRDRNSLSNPEWVSRPASGVAWQNEYGSNAVPSISADGRYVAFTSSHSNLVSEGESYPYYYDVFVRDRSTKSTELVTMSSCTTKANGDSYSSTISPDGRHVVFTSEATNLVAGDTNGFGDVFVHDRQLKDCIAPTTTANATIPNGTGTSSYTSGTPTNQNVTVGLNAQDNQDGSVIKEIRYSATGADAISQQTVTAANLPATFTIDAAGTTTISYFATDNAGNQESPKTFTVNIDRSAPRVSTATPTGTNVSRGTTALAYFSERMDPASITTSTFKLFRCSSTTSTNCTTQITDVSVTPTTDRLVASLNPFPSSPTTLLASKTKYKVVVTTEAKDEAGNRLDQDPSVVGNQDMVWYFTTGRK